MIFEFELHYYIYVDVSLWTRFGFVIGSDNDDTLLLKINYTEEKEVLLLYKRPARTEFVTESIEVVVSHQRETFYGQNQKFNKQIFSKFFYILHIVTAIFLLF